MKLAYFAKCKSSSVVYESLFITDTELCTFTKAGVCTYAQEILQCVR